MGSQCCCFCFVLLGSGGRLEGGGGREGGSLGGVAGWGEAPLQVTLSSFSVFSPSSGLA